ncbi:cytoplasmic dynein 2 light intermediate chain 1 isoform X1 [Nomia melanderi]|uniref:cytoplasmic dynein 2 light intermediate chain 1 isoform X1 n=1 Tax=Nomia melanderi TaxID=2448451 RepID=UPI003FCE8030
MAKKNSEENIRDAALRLCLEEEQHRKIDSNETHERSIIIVGTKKVGKTTMTYRFLEKEETPKPTIAIDYSFGRKAGKSLIKNIVHVWEVGHLTSSLVSAAMTGASLTHSPHHLTILMMLDLSQPEILWSSFEEALSVIRSAMKMSYDDKMIQELRHRRATERKRALEKEVDPFPIKLCIVGGKYDKFKDLDLNTKELMGKTLRATAHILGAGLYYHSSKDKTIVRRTKDILSYYGFGTQLSGGKCIDFEKPLIVSPGTDSFSSIDLQFPQTRPSAILDAIKQIYITRIPQVSRSSDITLEDPSNDPNFNEPIIDRLRAQREEVILIHQLDLYCFRGNDGFIFHTQKCSPPLASRTILLVERIFHLRFACRKLVFCFTICWKVEHLKFPFRIRHRLRLDNIILLYGFIANSSHVLDPVEIGRNFQMDSTTLSVLYYIYFAKNLQKCRRAMYKYNYATIKFFRSICFL